MYRIREVCGPHICTQATNCAKKGKFSCKISKKAIQCQISSMHTNWTQLALFFASTSYTSAAKLPSKGHINIQLVLAFIINMLPAQGGDLHPFSPTSLLCPTPP